MGSPVENQWCTVDEPVIHTRIVPVTIVFPTPRRSNGSDLWIVSMAGAVLTVLILFPLVYMGLRFPQQTIVQYSQSILVVFRVKW